MSMLQRFSLSSFAQSIKGATAGNQNFSKEDIESAISEIKALGKRAVTQQQNAPNANQTHINAAQDIKSILKLMKQFESNLYVQRVSCHALSNLAMQVVIARYIVSNNGFQCIRNALEKFVNDHKLCWLASSAIWNMARPPANRELIGKAGVKLMLKVLSIHYRKHEKVTNTAIGALSNLSLCESTKPLICKKQNISLVLNVLRLYATAETKSISVMTSGAGLLANLAVSDEHAETLLQYDALSVLIQLLQWKSSKTNQDMTDDNEQENEGNTVENTLHRNSCAALNNMVTAQDFISKILECNGVETIYTFINNTENNLFISLLENCLTTMECDVEHPVTTMHLCALHNKMELIKQMVLNASNIDNQMDIDDDSDGSNSSANSSARLSVGSHLWGNKASDSFTAKQLLNQTDGNNMTVLQYAALGQHYELIEFLVKCGASSDALEKSGIEDDSDQVQEISHQSKLDSAVEIANQKIETIANQHKEALQDALQDFPVDLCNFISTFENTIDMLQLADQFK